MYGGRLIREAHGLDIKASISFLRKVQSIASIKDLRSSSHVGHLILYFLGQIRLSSKTSEVHQTPEIFLEILESLKYLNVKYIGLKYNLLPAGLRPINSWTNFNEHSTSIEFCYIVICAENCP